MDITVGDGKHLSSFLKGSPKHFHESTFTTLNMGAEQVKQEDDKVMFLLLLTTWNSIVLPAGGY